MEKITLVLPQAHHQNAVTEYIEEHFNSGEEFLHGSSRLTEMESYGEWLRHLSNQADQATVSPDWVASTTLLALRESDQKLLGTINIRHELNDFLREFGGHIGYGVRPTERGKGYTTEILRLGLAHCRMLGLEKAMVACHKENVASARTIQRNGGVLEKEFIYTDGKTVQIYWIDLLKEK